LELVKLEIVSVVTLLNNIYVVLFIKDRIILSV
jgi:hypothetical protein